MAKRERTERRVEERAAKKLVRDRERLASLMPGGAEGHPVEVSSAAVIEVRIGSMPCPQCQGEYRVNDHRFEGAGNRAVEVACRLCGTKRTLWFRIVVDEPN